MISQGQKGFGLMEVVISMVFVAILGSSILYLLRGQNQATTAGGDLTIGAHFGKQKLDSLRVIPYRNLVSGSDTVDNQFIRAWAINTGAGRKTILMNVFWPLSGDHHIFMHTIVSDDQFKVE